MRKGTAFAILLCCESLLCSKARAWIFPEHRDIGRAAINGLEEKTRIRLNEIWKKANTAKSPRLCALPSEPAEVPMSGGTECADMGTLFAFAGDHSCSPEDMEDLILHSDWFPKLSQAVAELKKDIHEAGSTEKVNNVLSDSNTSLPKIDARYLVRAAGNNAHFPLSALPVSEHEDLRGFLKRSTNASAPMNAIGIYSRLHMAALAYAKAGMAREAIMSEGFALHFLEDSFSSGHYAGTWGEAALRKGTHDYYCEAGLVSQTWAGNRISAHGDGFMQEQDVKQTSVAVADSLRQLAYAFSTNPESLPPEAKSFDGFQREVCKSISLPAPTISDHEIQILQPILNQAPVPSEGESGVSLPRFRIETGPFISVNSGLRFGGALGSLGESNKEDVRTIGRLELVGRLGLGTAGVLSKQSDGAMFVEGGIVFDGKQYNDPQLDSRSGMRFGMRMPFWILPGDLLLLGPIFYFANPETLQNIAISASNGGILGLEKKIATGIGTFQLMAGRQIAISLFGYNGQELPRITTANGEKIGEYKSMEFDFPIIEYQPNRSFSSKIAFNIAMQLGYAYEKPKKIILEVPNTGPNSTSMIYLRLSLEGIKYW